MTQRELKEVACNSAHKLMSALSQINDGDFVDDILAAVASNDEIEISEILYDNVVKYE